MLQVVYGHLISSSHYAVDARNMKPNRRGWHEGMEAMGKIRPRNEYKPAQPD